MGSARWPEQGGGGDLTSVASANGSVTVTGGTGPDVDLSVPSALGMSPMVTATQSSSATTLGVDVTAYGDGIYRVEFEGVTAAACVLLWRFNSGAAVSPVVVYIQNGPQAPLLGVPSTNNAASAYAVNFVNGLSGTCTVSFYADFACRNGVLSPWDAHAHGTDGTRNVLCVTGGRHTPNAVLTNIGLAGSSDGSTVDTNINSGSILRVKKIGA